MMDAADGREPGDPAALHMCLACVTSQQCDARWRFHSERAAFVFYTFLINVPTTRPYSVIVRFEYRLQLACAKWQVYTGMVIFDLVSPYTTCHGHTERSHGYGT